MIFSGKVAARRYGVRTSIADERSQENSKQKRKQNKISKVTKKIAGFSEDSYLLKNVTFYATCKFESSHQVISVPSFSTTQISSNF